jgi:ADP-heptose:LPS heptosyltransferase
MSRPPYVEPRFDRVSRIVVLRGGGIGDLILALPALEALRATYPTAELVLLGSPAHAELLTGRRSPVSRVEVLPIAEGVRESPARTADPAELRAFRDRLRHGGPIDLAVQLHGGGRYSNPFLLSLGARHTVGLVTDDAEPLERTMPYMYYQHETMRWLEVVGLAGAAPVTTEPHLEVTAAEVDATARHLPRAGAPLAVVHPGASDPRRRWPVERFAAVIDGLLDDGAVVRVVGGPEDRELATELVRMVEHDRRGRVSPINALAGTLELGRTAALFAAADVVVANDSGPRHLAQAVGAPTVGIYWFGNVVNAGPFGRRWHRVHLSCTTSCPVCGIDVTQVGWSAERCDHDVTFVADVDVDPVLADARRLMATSSPRPGTRGALAPRTLAAG